MSALDCRDVTIVYGRQAVVSSLDLSVTSGEWLGLIGPNGAGKSSLLRSIAGLVEHRGSLALDGEDLGVMTVRSRAQRVAYVPQEPVIPDDMSAEEYVGLGRWPYLGRFGSRRERIRSVATWTWLRSRSTKVSSG